MKRRRWGRGVTVLVLLVIVLSLVRGVGSAQEVVLYPTSDACWEAHHTPCSLTEGGWSPGLIGDPTKATNGEHQYDQENLRRQSLSMRLNTSGTIDSPVVAVDMNQVHFPDVQPYLDSTVGRVRVPVRFVSEQMGANVAWDGDTQKVTVTRDGLTVELWVDNPNVVVNGRNVTIDAPPTLVAPGRVMVPLRFMSEAFGAVVDWVGTESPEPQFPSWGTYQVWIWVDWGYWGKYSIEERLNVFQWWFYRGGK